jgi:molybdenum cofactor cytidylyltransferase
MKRSLPKSRLSCILLAAGMSKRMGAENKLLIEINDEPLIRRTTRLLLDYGMEEIIVVLGYQSKDVHAAIEDLPVSCVVNSDYERGQMTSVHAGLTALTRETDGVMIFLADLLLITADDIRDIHASYEHQDANILVPQFQQIRGNPIIFSPVQRDSILAGEKNLGCRKLISNNPELVTVFESTNDHVICDLDTPESLILMSQRLGLPIGQYASANISSREPDRARRSHHV